ncbi:isoleucine--tRNA ligase [Candidatus Parcubacteria bacterium]|nr:isoleucine--tRNA ligase [Candidatus Parcubacteria bacterium]
MDFAKHEEETLASWKKRGIFKKTVEKDAPKGPFVFFEGPPTANGRPGIHHAEPRAFKDCIPRFRMMQGYRVVRKGGWDTHGLPVEIEVEKQLGFTNKAQIEAYGIAKFNELCKQNVWKYLKEWETFTQRLGFWVDLENAYITYAPTYVESLWWVIKQVWDRGWLYKDYRVTPHCPRCETSLSSHELSQGYKDVKDLSVTAKFLLTGTDEYVLAWTTTPWTLPGNVALAVGKEIEYVRVKILRPASPTSESYWLAKQRLGILKEPYEIVEEVKGEALVGRRYEPLYPYLGNRLSSPASQHASKDPSARPVQAGLAGNDHAWSIIPADFVTTEDGTGIVHTAVMYGQDDFELGTKVGLPKHHLVHRDGTFMDGMDFLSGRLVTDAQVAVDIIKDLAHRGLLFSKEAYEHSYPHCWRCKSKVIYYAKDSWYIRMSGLRDEMIRQNEHIHWEPEHLKDGRFGEWLREVKDWAFSRERYWGTPLPIWECTSCAHRMCIGSFEELFSLCHPAQQTGAEGSPGSVGITGQDFDPHRPFVDEMVLKCETCGGQAKRVLDVCDVWFDSGAMPFAQWHYPFENKEFVDSGEGYPADYISEAIDQTRGWFYTLLAVATLLGRERPFKNVICLGHVLDAQGKKMSKSLGNIVEPMEMMDKHGADAVRWYMYTINQPGESKRFDEKALVEMVRQNFGILWNIVEFYKMFSPSVILNEPVDGAQGNLSERRSSSILDRWILARLHKLTKETTQRLEAYIITETVRELGVFITDFSTWYVRRSRERFKGTDQQDKQAALATLQECLLTLSKLMAPFAPFLSERVYEAAGGQKESVHLEDWPMYDEALVDEQILSDMLRTREVVSRALERRAEAGVNVRQPLASLLVFLPSGTISEEYLTLIKDEVNVKQAEVKEGALSVELELTLTPELVREGIVRELIRRTNALRKQVGLTIADRIELSVSGSAEVMKAVEEHTQTLLQSTLADAFRLHGDALAHQESFKVNDLDVTIGIEKRETVHS